ncbi:MAG: Origin recognition complex subunit 2 [Ramalina farinacea]|uniref:Origin recognition complex subunit 2 n=1 Tax=Ramalina farinacea TaxID=258253 RepID=A0AA43QT15_9LECA|nr:Origin recognition complex subunit 2 [Ramalina farinacea]
MYEGEEDASKVADGNPEKGLTMDSSLETPSKKRRGRPPGSTNKSKSKSNGRAVNEAVTPKGKGKVLFPDAKHASHGSGKPSTPASKLVPETPSRSQRTRRSKTLSGLRALGGSDDGLDEDEGGTPVRQDDQAEDDLHALSEDQEASDRGADTTLETPSKGTPKKRRRKKSATPPQSLAPYERYFWANRPGRVKTSNNTLAGISLLSHEEYHDLAASYQDPHADAYRSLHKIHTRSFPQWRFELSEDFNICLYGYGSKRRLVTEFADYLHDHETDPRIFVVNGYLPTLNLRNVLTTLATLVFDCKTHELPSNLGAQPRDIIASIISHLTEHPPDDPIYLFINSLDATPLRRSPTPALLAQLASHPSIRVLATCDTPNFPLLWDVNLRDKYNWLFHDTTTFQSFAGVEIGSVVDEFNELLGQSGRTVTGKGGASYVLKSLMENARSLYRVLLAEILAAADTGNLDEDRGSDDDDGGEGATAGGELGGMERKALFQKVVEEFICSSEMGFTQLLNEFYDHDMLVDRKDADGTRVLGVPWTRGECEEILEELMG